MHEHMLCIGMMALVLAVVLAVVALAHFVFRSRSSSCVSQGRRWPSQITRLSFIHFSTSLKHKI